MRKIFLILTVLAATIFATSCMNEPIDPVEPTDNTGFFMHLEVIQGSTEAGTRVATIPAMPTETEVHDLFLLFFNPAGNFVTYLDKSPPALSGEPLEMTAPLRVELGGTTGLDPNTEYRILVVANIETMVGIAGDWLDGFVGMTFHQAQAHLLETSEASFIHGDQLLMSSTVVRRAGQVMVHAQLVRALVRFDVVMEVPGYELYSVAVWNVPRVTALWNSDHNDFRYHTEYFSSVSGLPTLFPGETEFRGILYSFENSVTNSYQGDEHTTCLILGIRPTTGTNAGRVTYYRVNVNEQGAQLLRRNFVYEIRITGINNLGENTPRDAWSGAQTWLDINVRNWQDGAGSAVMFDGEDILAVGGNRIDFTGEGGTESITIFTFSPDPTNVLSMVGATTTGSIQELIGDGNNGLPVGISAELSGTTMTVIATPTPAGSPRDGHIEVMFGTMRATVIVVQSDRQNLWLNLDVGTMDIPMFPQNNQVNYNLGLGGGTNLMDVLGRNITVDSSGPWTAVIHNGRFRFGTVSTPTGTPAYGNLYSRITGVHNDNFSVATIDALLQPENHYAFIIVTLDADPTINRVVVLRQDGNSRIRLFEPTKATLYFTPEGLPERGGTYVDVYIDHTHPFATTLSGMASSAFTASQPQVRVGGPTDGMSFITISANGQNTTPLDLQATVSAFLTIDPSTHTLIQLRQRAHTISVSPTAFEPISQQGGTATITVTTTAPNFSVAPISVTGLPPGMTHNVTATVSGNQITVNFPQNTNVNVFPLATVRVYVTGMPAVWTEVQIQQGQRVIVPVHITTARTVAGAWTGGSASNLNDFGRLRMELASNTNFGPVNAVVPAGARSFSLGQSGANSRGRLPDNTTLIHQANRASYNAAERAALDAWLRGDPRRVLIITNDGSSTAAYLPTFGFTGTSRSGTQARIVRDNNVGPNRMNQNLYEFLFMNGPFSSAPASASVSGNVQLRPRTGIGGTARNVAPTFQTIMFHPVNHEMEVAIDPVRRIVYVGDPQLFGIGTRTNTVWSGANVEFVQNLAAWIINTTQQGEAFTSQFHD